MLAGGTGTRLRPLTLVTSKQLLPVYDKPMIYYPLTTLMLAGVRETLVISTPRDIDSFSALLGDGSAFGMSISYAIQDHPRGLPDAFIVGESFLDGMGGALALGDNLTFGSGMGRQLRSVAGATGGSIFAIEMKDPRAYGVVELDDSGAVLSIEEKPEFPKSNLAIPGIYFYDKNVVEYSKQLSLSPRGELEIVDLHMKYLEAGNLSVTKLSRGSTWMDMGTPDSLLEASIYVSALERRQGLVLGSPEEAAWRNGWITGEDLLRRAADIGDTPYARYLRDLPMSGQHRHASDYE